MSAEPARTRADTDADKLARAVDAIRAGAPHLARSLLREIVANAPARYAHQTEDGDTLTVRFWDLADFLHYVVWMRQAGAERKVVWERAVYPPAFYYLALLAVEDGDHAAALDHLARGEALEPTNPMFALERAQALSRMREYEQAIECYRRVGEVGPFVSPKHRAVALRGEAVALIDLGRLDDAEARLRESLALEPDNRIALDELRYIEHLRAGGRTAPTRLVTTGDGVALRCEACGSEELDGAKMAELHGRPAFLCKQCQQPPDPPRRKRWWQFWR